MDGAATLVWVAPAPASVEQSRALASFARAHGVRLVPPEGPPADRGGGAAAQPAAGWPFEARLADAVETELDHARDAIAAGDSAAAERALAAAESTLRAHAEWPEGAWLMAEVERARATRWRRVAPLDPEGARRAWALAEALDGGRVAGLGEEPEASEATPQPLPESAVALETSAGGPAAGLRPWLDGRPVEAPVFVTRAGPHALVLTAGGAPVWATWIDPAPGRFVVRVDAAAAAPCSPAELAGVHLAADGAAAARGVACPRWLLATTAGAGASADGVRVALCAADRCGPFADWRAPLPWTWSPPAPAERRGGWPAWATWAIVGVGVGAGAALAAGVALAASGALQKPAAETRFVIGGVRSQ
ncbi:MAG: hypothetical protein JOZ69_07220 [Myxococcales bacterium]|nr:hypothetical protein [Myxococcales bacterium]